ncbi:ADP-dependent glucokinase-like isoform X2 [Styela clava]
MLPDNLSAFKYGTATVVLAIAFFVAHQRSYINNELDVKVLNSLRRAESKVSPGPAKVAVGFGACIDVFVDALPLFEKLGIKPPTKSSHHEVITNFDNLAEGFAYFFRHGAAAERYFSNLTLFDDIVKMARTLEGVRSDRGGNAPVMAHRLAMEGADVMLAAPTNDEFMKMLWPGIKSTVTESKDPDIHLIMEYKTGDKWGQYTSERANRFIIHSDQSNPTLSSLEPLIEPMKSFNPKLLVVGGLQMMDNFPFQSGQREERLNALRNLLKNPPPGTNPLVHFELASFVEEDLVSDLINYVAPYVDSFGMNEQELPNLESALRYGNITILSEAYPRVASVLDQMRTAYKILRRKFQRVSRIHVHTLAFQAIMTRKGSQWKNTMSAAAHASLTANRHVCGTKVVNISKSKLLMDDSFTKTLHDGSTRVYLEPERPVSCWEEVYNLVPGKYDTVQICIAPNFVCTEVYQTVGGGDNISSAGLAMQI